MSTQDPQSGGQIDAAAQDCIGTDGTEAVPEVEQLNSIGFYTPLPRPRRQRKRAKADRGLPPDKALEALARAYLEHQRKLFPKLTDTGLLPVPSDATIAQMVDDFKERHRTGKVDVESVRPFTKVCAKLGGSYNRFSCDNSSPTSALDQMVNALEKAHSEGRFIPWAYVFADYSVTGLDPARQGYTSYKTVLANGDHFIETTYIDDFSRASRDEMEWWKLAALSKRLNKRMIGASDGFNLSSPDWDLKITIYGLVSRLFIKGLREKVRRGMRGAARRGTCLGRLSLGFTRRPHRDKAGNAVNGPDGLPLYEVCIDPMTRQYRLMLYELFIQKNWSAYKIARYFNKLNVDGWQGWTGAAVKKLLFSPSSIGILIWNRARREYDHETGKWVVVQNPRSEWVVFYNRDLAIVPMEMFRAARRKLAAMRRNSPLTGRKPGRNQVSATTLFSGTLYCDDCGQELKLIRSAGGYKQMGCLNGVFGHHGCKLSSSKSVRVIEEFLLEYIRDSLLTESMIEELAANVNAAVEQEAQKPQVNTLPLKADLRRKETSRDRLVRKIEETDDAELSAGYHKRVLQLTKEIKDLSGEIRASEGTKRKRIKPLSVKKAKSYLADLREILNQEIPVAAEAIRVLTGSIRIRQEPIPGRKRGARWIAMFSPDLIRLLQHVAPDDFRSSLPTDNNGSGGQVVEVVIEKVPVYEKLAPKFKILKDNGVSIQTIAAAHGMCWTYADEIIHFAETGERPNWKRPKKTGTGRGKSQKYKEIAEEVARLHETEKMSFKKISKTLHVGEGTVRRAYDHARPQAVRDAVETGKTPNRGPYSHLNPNIFKTIRKLLIAGKKTEAEIAAIAGCGKSTVNRVRQKMKSESGEAPAA